jgi:hypothetical protein
MPIQIYQSAVGAAKFGGANRAATQTATLSVQGDPLIKLALGAGKQVSESFLKKVREDEEIKQASDILDEANRYYEDTRTFEHDYKFKRTGSEARGAAGDFEEFHRQQYNQRAQRFAGDARATLMWQRQAGQIRTSSVGRGMAYSEQQDKLYRTQVTKQKTELYHQKVAEAPTDKSVNNLRLQYNTEIAAINTPEMTDILMAQADQETALTRINTAIAQNDVPEAQRLLSEYREAGVLGSQTDEMIKKVETARVNDEAFTISEEIRLTMPDATKAEKLAKADKLAGDDAEVYKASRYQINQDHSAAISIQKEQDQLITDMFTTKTAAAKTPAERKQIELEIMNTPMRDSVRTKLLKQNAQGLKQPLTSDETKLKEVEQRVAVEGLTQGELDRDYKWQLSKDDYKLQSDRLKTTGGNRVNAYNLTMEDRLSRAFAEDGKKKKEKTKRFKALMNQFVKEYQTQHGRLPGDREMKEQEDWLLEQVIYDEDIIFHETTERFMVDTLDPSKFDVPDNIKADISSQFKAANIEPTEEKVIEVYKRYLMDKK